MLKISLIIFILSNYVSYLIAQCNSYSPTTVSGTHAPKGQICSGQLIFEDNFDEFDLKKWSHEITLGGGGVSNLIMGKHFFLLFLIELGVPMVHQQPV